jgi:hypothetical protein
MKNKISLQHINHNNAPRMAYFLNEVDEELKEVPYEWKSLKLADRITTALRYVSEATTPVTITVFFCDSYSDGNEIAKENEFPYSPKAKWSLNGDLMYLVESEDEEKVSEILSLFAGEE